MTSEEQIIADCWYYVDRHGWAWIEWPPPPRPARQTSIDSLVELLRDTALAKPEHDPKTAEIPF